MEEILQDVKIGKTDRKCYQEKLAKVNNLGRKEWIHCEHPLLMVIDLGKADLVDLFIHMGVHVNSVKKSPDNSTQVSF